MVLIFLRRRLDDRIHAQHARIQPLDEPLDAPAFPRRVRAFEDHQQRMPRVDQLSLEIEEPELQILQLLLVGVLLDRLVFDVVELERRALRDGFLFMRGHGEGFL